MRRVAKKSDFLRYAAYEMGLEQLRRKRLQRLSTCSDPYLTVLTLPTRLSRPSKVKVNDIRLCTRPEAVSNIRACTQEVQVRRWPLDTVYPGGETRRRTRFSGAHHRTVGARCFLVEKWDLPRERHSALCNFTLMSPPFTSWLHPTSCRTCHRLPLALCYSAGFD